MQTFFPQAQVGPDLSRLRVAIVHFWLVNPGGAERVLSVLAGMFPQADIFTLFVRPETLAPGMQKHKITTSPLQKIPRAHRYYRMLLPLFPMLLENFCLDDYDLVISSESGPAKGILTRAATCHVCYCHTPMRYIWDMYHHYRSTAPLGGLGRMFYALTSHYIRQWDLASASRVDHFVASSWNGAARIRKYYRRGADVIYPPVDVGSFSLAAQQDDFYLVVSRLVSYKRIDLAIAACNTLKRPLTIIGQGEQMAALRKAAGPTITFLGYQPEEVIRDYYRRCRALIFPGEEDIGLTPIEAQASGRPVIAFGRGGALETVRGFFSPEDFEPVSSTGMFFSEQSSGSLAKAIQVFETIESRFCRETIRSWAWRFDVSRFKSEMSLLLAARIAEFREQSRIKGGIA